ncbi:flavoprotein [Promicromonospora sp. AC04]|uniref:flavoprotein n=1 Tax=Promicromonospora sp. AC04 TaxID=2135723 RepID=UPI000D3C55AA|nr:flavoprotein [Promicromonospora sp. AC04]
MSTRSLYIIASAAPPVQHLDRLLDVLDDGWQPCLILTPTAATWVDVDALSARVRGLLRIEPRTPQEPDPLPRADAVLAAPVTFNTLNKWAAGISDTLALGLLNEAIGLDMPVLAAPVIKAALRAHPAYSASTAALRNASAHIMDPDAVTIRREDGTVTADWQAIARRLDELAPTTPK